MVAGNGAFMSMKRPSVFSMEEFEVYGSKKIANFGPTEKSVIKPSEKYFGMKIEN